MKNLNIVSLIQDEPWLEEFQLQLEERSETFRCELSEIEKTFGNISEFANIHQYYGIHFESTLRKGWIYREWAPSAHQLFLLGDFNDWNRTSHPMRRNPKGDWEIFLPFEAYRDRFIHQSKVKVHIISEKGELDRIPAYIRSVIQDPINHDFAGQIWFPNDAFVWEDQGFNAAKSLKQPLIYECHIGMAQEKLGVGTYIEFEDLILPRIHAAGYNTIQLMAVMEHPYYGSFGYHVSNFFAPTSRFGTPEELKSLINAAHQMGIAVVMDIVHSHAVKNVNEGLNEFDGSDNQYFHAGARGYHEGWDSKLFDYGKREVRQFLLSNIKYWMEEFHFDGFRFDGATSIIYKHHGLTSFDSASKYFDHEVDSDALLYLQLATTLIHHLNKNSLSIAEEVSGMPGLCRSIKDGGIGFDFRLAMGIPDFWIKMLKHKPDEHWDMFELWHELTNRPKKEKSIAYAESHDQALVGDKSIAFWLMDKEMYSGMSLGTENIAVDRGIALHKLIRLITLSLGGEGYLNFIGNEFGHPEWVDFPRIGNKWSYEYARRQWSLVDSPDLRYQQLDRWDKSMIKLATEYSIFTSASSTQLHLDADQKILAFERTGLIFIFSFHPSESFFGYQINMPSNGKYEIILHTDEEKFGGFDRIDKKIQFETNAHSTIQLYIPNRTAMILRSSK